MGGPPIGILAVCVFLLLMGNVTEDPRFQENWAPFAILMLDSILASDYLPLEMLRVHAGYPGTQNAREEYDHRDQRAAEWTLDPHSGAEGSRRCTAAAFLLAVVYLKILASIKG